MTRNSVKIVSTPSLLFRAGGEFNMDDLRLGTKDGECDAFRWPEGTVFSIKGNSHHPEPRRVKIVEGRAVDQDTGEVYRRLTYQHWQWMSVE